MKTLATAICRTVGTGGGKDNKSRNGAENKTEPSNLWEGCIHFEEISGRLLIFPSLIFPQNHIPPEYIIMDAVSISKALANRTQGSFFAITMKRLAKTLKGVTEVIEKETIMTGQLCDYAKRAAVKNAVADGDREAPELPSHIESVFHVGGVKFWQGKSGKTYLPMPLAGNKSKVTWFLGGEPVEYSEVEQYLLASDKPKKAQDKDELAEKGQVPFVGIDIDNILEVR